MVGFRLPFFEIEIFFDTIKSSVEENVRAVQNAQNYCLTPKTRILRSKNVRGERLILICTLVIKVSVVIQYCGMSL